MSKIFTQKELEDGFNLVKDPTDWKNPINTKCKEEETHLIECAVNHFTGTDACFFKIGPAKQDKGRFKKGDIIWAVTSEGYNNRLTEA